MICFDIYKMLHNFASQFRNKALAKGAKNWKAFSPKLLVGWYSVTPK